MNNTRRVAALAVAAALTLVACNGDESDTEADDVAADVTDADDETTDDETTDDETADDEAADDDASAGSVSPGLRPEATIPDDVPEEFLPAVGPVDVAGDPLPPFPEPGQDDPAIGLTAPTLFGLSPDGDPVRVDATQFGPTLVMFLAHWCGFCNEEVPLVNQLRDRNALPEDLEIVAVATGSRPDSPNFPPGDWLVEKDWTFPAMLDGVDLEAGQWVAANAYGVTGFPGVILLDENGVVLNRWSATRNADELLGNIESSLG